LTVLYGSLFLLSGIALLAITYFLVLHATDGPLVVNGPVVKFSGPDGNALPELPPLDLAGPDGLTPDQLDAQTRELEAQAARQRAADLHHFLTQSGIALGAMTVISIVLGWIVAGRLLLRVRTITTTAQLISSTNLHERLALDGPDDELKQLGDTFDSLLGRLEASFRSQLQFVSNASHELRTPLARQRTLAQVALADPEASVDSLRQAHERVIAAGRQQERLIEALLTLARSEAGLDRREPLDLADLTAPLLAVRNPQAGSPVLRVEATLDPAPTTGDRRLVERLVANLLDNALRHNVPDGRIEVTTGTSEGKAVVSVVNSGPIIPAGALDRLFQPFQRIGAERTRQDGGLGLGLSIVQGIATAHDAVLTADALPAGGLAVVVTFPDGTAGDR